VAATLAGREMPLPRRLQALNQRHNPLVHRRWARYVDPAALAEDHFARYSQPDHINYTSMRDAAVLLGGRSATILETGTSAWGTDSTRLWDGYVRAFGGRFWSVDLRAEPRERLAGAVGPNTTLLCADSVDFLTRWVAEHPGVQPDLVYLDSYDVDFGAPEPAGEHCVRELEAVRPALGPGSLVLVDDTPGSLDGIPPELHEAAERIHAEHGAWPGKGMFLDRWLCERGEVVEKVHHRYQVLYRF
jgi:hypothetical protein